MRAGLGIDWISVPHGDGDEVMIWTDDYELRKLTVSWARTPALGVVQDADQCTFHFLNLTSGEPDDTWTTGDFTAVEAAFDTFWNAIKTHYVSGIKLSEYAWRKDGPAFRPFGASLSPTVRVVPRNLPGTGGSISPLPPQCAMTVTEVTSATFLAHGVGVPGHAPGTGRTQTRNRWGRFYLPALDTAVLGDGRYTSAICDTVSTAVQTMYNACVSAQLVPVMYSPTTGSSWSIDAIHVDDIVDVIRSRRYEQPLTRSPKTINAV